MDEKRLLRWPAFAGLPVYDESDERSHSLLAGAREGRAVRECASPDEVEECLRDPGLVPLGAVRAAPGGSCVVVAYFGERA